AVAGDRLVPLLASREGHEHDPWPPSPPLQELYFHPAGDTPTAMLVGMAGSSHWSVAVQLVQAQQALYFDVACRIKGKLPERADGQNRGSPLSSVYRTLACPLPESIQAARLVLHDLAVRLATEPADPSADPEDIQLATISTAEDTLQIVPSPGTDSSPRTVRWRYGLRHTNVARQTALQ
ncbi:MAG: hypothetical protein GTN77_07085, partial [Planctomycetales bacterium]|nr:hypothetical protein [Planctomycetales bacterium]